MKSLMYMMVVLCLSVVGYPVSLGFAADEEYSAISKEAHPRLILSTKIITRIRSVNFPSYSKDYRELIAYAKWRLYNTPPSVIAHRDFQPETILPLCLAALISQNDQLTAYVVSSITDLAEIPVVSGNDTDQRQRLLSLSFGLDWLYNQLSEEQRQKLSSAISGYIRHLSYFTKNPKYSGGHDRFGSVAILAGVLATAGETEGQSERVLLAKLRMQWSQGYNRFQQFAAHDGGYIMGWQYGAGYTTIWPYLIGERLGLGWLAADWIRDLPLWYIYGQRGDGTFPRTGDCNDCRVGQHLAMLMAYVASKYSDSRAEWFYRKNLESLWGPYRIWRIIFPATVKSVAPDHKEKTLPLSRHFSGSGLVVARDRWDNESTQLVFKSSPYYSVNHHHKDQNHFELSYRGSLLIDSGCYDLYGSTHWLNYYTRTIAHNTLVVFSGSDKYLHNGKTVSNDGGQIFRSASGIPSGEEPVGLDDALSDKFRLDGIVGFSGTNDGVWIRGDATKAYDRKKVKSFVRDVVMVYKPLGRNHPLLLVFDRIALNGRHLPQILFHFNDKPILTGKSFEVRNSGGGFIRGTVFGDQAVEFNLVGGADREWLVNGVNYPPENVCGGRDGTDLGAWRLQVEPKDTVENMELMSVLAVDDKGALKVGSEYLPITGNKFRGVVAGQDMVLLVRDRLDGVLSFEDERFNEVERVVVAGNYSEDSTVKVNGKFLPLLKLVSRKN